MSLQSGSPLSTLRVSAEAGTVNASKAHTSTTPCRIRRLVVNPNAASVTIIRFLITSLRLFQQLRSEIAIASSASRCHRKVTASINARRRSKHKQLSRNGCAAEVQLACSRARQVREPSGLERGRFEGPISRPVFPRYLQSVKERAAGASIRTKILCYRAASGRRPRNPQVSVITRTVIR